MKTPNGSLRFQVTLKKFDLLGSLIVNGHISASTLNLDNATVEGALVFKPYFCRLWNSANIACNPTSTLTFDTERYNAFGMHSLTSNTSRITFPRKGVVLFGAGAQFATNATGYRSLGAYLSGSGVSVSSDVRMTVTTGGFPTLTTISGAIPVIAGDYLEIQASQNSGVFEHRIRNGLLPHVLGLANPDSLR